jgi:hypothetical protein
LAKDGLAAIAVTPQAQKNHSSIRAASRFREDIGPLHRRRSVTLQPQRHPFLVSRSQLSLFQPAAKHFHRDAKPSKPVNIKLKHKTSRVQKARLQQFLGNWSLSFKRAVKKVFPAAAKTSPAAPCHQRKNRNEIFSNNSCRKHIWYG